MAVHAYVFVECAPGRPTQVADALAQVAGVEMAHAVTGAYDVIAFVRTDSVAALGDLLSHHIHRMPGVLKTTTNVVVQERVQDGGTRSDRGTRA